MIDVKKASEKIAELGMLSFFPTEPFARAAVVALVCGMAEDNSQVDWLVRRCNNIWSKWEGPSELRSVFCSKFRPRDGVEAYSLLPQFADGIPSEEESLSHEERIRLEVQSYKRISGRSEPATDFPTNLSDLIDLVRYDPPAEERKYKPQRIEDIHAQTEEIKRQQAENRARMASA